MKTFSVTYVLESGEIVTSSGSDNIKALGITSALVIAAAMPFVASILAVTAV